MNDFLKETYYCNHSHPAIRQLAEKLSDNATHPADIAENSFNYVRDSIITGYDKYQMKASDTLKKGYGICWGKSVLLTALLRANHIEAAFGTIPVHRKFIEPLIGKMFHFVNSPYHHCVVHACIDNRWTLLDTVLDKITYNTFFLPKKVEWTIDWNGKDDCRLYTESIEGEPVVHEEFDSVINNKAGNTELPAIFSAPLYHYLNRKIWKKTGITPA